MLCVLLHKLCYICAWSAQCMLSRCERIEVRFCYAFFAARSRQKQFHYTEIKIAESSLCSACMLMFFSCPFCCDRMLLFISIMARETSFFRTLRCCSGFAVMNALAPVFFHMPVTQPREPPRCLPAQLASASHFNRIMRRYGRQKQQHNANSNNMRASKKSSQHSCTKHSRGKL